MSNVRSGFDDIKVRPVHIFLYGKMFVIYLSKILTNCYFRHLVIPLQLFRV